jgi:hypothetical protein
VPHRAIPGFNERRFGKSLIGRFEFLQANDIGRRFLKSTQQAVEPTVDAIDIEGSNLQPALLRKTFSTVNVWKSLPTFSLFPRRAEQIGLVRACVQPT